MWDERKEKRGRRRRSCVWRASEKRNQGPQGVQKMLPPRGLEEESPCGIRESERRGG